MKNSISTLILQGILFLCIVSTAAELPANCIAERRYKRRYINEIKAQTIATMKKRQRQSQSKGMQAIEMVTSRPNTGLTRGLIAIQHALQKALPPTVPDSAHMFMLHISLIAAAQGTIARLDSVSAQGTKFAPAAQIALQSIPAALLPKLKSDMQFSIPYVPSAAGASGPKKQ